MQEHNYLDELTEAYDASFPYALDNRLILNWYPQRIVERCHGGTLLELGVGHGYSSVALTPHFSKHTIVEGSSEIIRLFRSRHPDKNIEIVHGLFEDYTPAMAYDVIVMGFVLEHVEDPDVVLARYAGYLAPGGTLYVTVPNAMALHRRLGHEAGMLPDYFSLSDADRALGHRRTFSVETLRATIERHGLRVEHMEGLMLKPVTTAQVLDLKLPEEILQAMLRVGVGYPELSVGIMAEARLPA